MPPRHVLVVFDVDGTLVDLPGAGSRALGRAFAELFGLQGALAGVSFAGRTDLAIVRTVLRDRGVVDRSSNPRDADVARIFARYEELMPEEIERTPYGATPGAREILAALRARPGVHVGIATGNLEKTTGMKLASAGIATGFEFAAYGSLTEDRTALVRSAIEQGEALVPAGAAVRAFVVGDTPHDVAAAHAAGAVAVAVATGPFSLEELRARGPEHATADLAEALALGFWDDGRDLA